MKPGGNTPGPDTVPEHEARIYAVIARIPEGTVATYGQIAEIAGTGPRQVGRALRTMPHGVDVPWHRVVNARGEISLRSATGEPSLRQRALLEAEGIEFAGGRIDLSVYRWEPEADA